MTWALRQIQLILTVKYLGAVHPDPMDTLGFTNHAQTTTGQVMSRYGARDAHGVRVKQ